MHTDIDPAGSPNPANYGLDRRLRDTSSTGNLRHGVLGRTPDIANRVVALPS